MISTKKYYYFTVLSNWLTGYDKYSRRYSKENITQSSFPNEFYLLDENQLDIGFDKSSKLLAKLNIPHNKIIRICTELNPDNVKINTKNYKGFVLDTNSITVSSVSILEQNDYIDKTVEDVTALSYLLNPEGFKSYNELKPRSVSYLPVAQACQAKCWFCFSESSISFEKKYQEINFETLESYLKKAKDEGAERFVITGGGEPGLLKWKDLIQTISIGKKYFDKVVLITNGIFLSYKLKELEYRIRELETAGLSVLSVSRHSHKEEENQRIMGVETRTTQLLKNIKRIGTKLTVRLICVIQKNGISKDTDIEQYIKYSSDLGVNEICFKELYVASSFESIYTNATENQYSKEFQIPLNVVINYLEKKEFVKISELPWGSPVYSGEVNGSLIKIAAYTEPSVGWERSTGICRSWNIMADMKTYSNLEDLNSIIEIKGNK